MLYIINLYLLFVYFSIYNIINIENIFYLLFIYNNVYFLIYKSLKKKILLLQNTYEVYYNIFEYYQK